MAQTKKELVLKAMDAQQTERVPVGFWFHFLDDEIKADAFADPYLTDKLLEGQLKYIDEHQPDFVKIMTDGFFPYKNPTIKDAHSLEGLSGIKPLPGDAPWFARQVAYAKQITGRYDGKLAFFYNLFCAGTILKFMQPAFEDGEPFLAELVREHPAEAKRILDVISGDVARLAKRLITEAGVTGIYFSLQNLLGEGIDRKLYEEVLAPGEKAVLAAAQKVSDYNILHVCGYAGHHNDLTWYRDYPAKTINWAVVVEGSPLAEGRNIFDGRSALGGFGNLDTSVLYSGTRAEVEAETKRILQEAGRTGILLGADCTVPCDIAWERFDWVRAAANG